MLIAHWNMVGRLKRLLLPLAMLGLLAGTAAPAAAASNATPPGIHRIEVGRSLHLSGASPTYDFSHLPSYEYTNHGAGNFGGPMRWPVTWNYVEDGLVTGASSSVLTSAVYTIDLGRAKPGLSFQLHAIPSTYQIHYDTPATAPCSTGTFSYDLREGATAHGKFAPLVVGSNCLPTYSLDITIRPGSDADRELNG